MTHDRDERWAELLRRANRADRGAYTQFLTEIAPVLRRLIVARNQGRTDGSEDILQNTLIAIHEKRHTWRETDPVSHWIYAIARYKTADAWRQRLRHATAPFDGAELQITDEAVPDPTSARDLDRLLSRLDNLSAAVVRGMKLQGLSAGETGHRLGMSASAVRVKLHRALARLSADAAEDQNPASRQNDGGTEHDDR